MNALFKKVCLGAALAVASAVSADTAVMSWMLDMAEADSAYQNLEFTQLRVYAQDESGTKYSLGVGDAVAGSTGYGTAPTTWDSVVAVSAADLAQGTPYQAGPYYANLSTLTTTEANNYSEYLFFIELLDANSNLVGWGTSGQKAPSEAIVSYFGNDMFPAGEMAAMSTLSFGSGVVPEPTSGLLLLVGGALLALRRRRRAC